MLHKLCFYLCNISGIITFRKRGQIRGLYRDRGRDMGVRGI